MIPAVKYKVSTSNESITATLYQQQQVSLTWLARRPPHTLLRKPVVASPLSENREHCRHLSHFPPQIWKIWKIAIQQVRSPAWWSETVRQHMNTTGLLNIGKGKPTKTNEFLDMFRRGRGEGGRVKGRLELFRKFIRFGRGMLPYWVTVFAKVNVYLRISKNIITTVKWRTFTGKLIAIAKRRSIQPNQLIIVHHCSQRHFQQWSI